jgi:hypothetical protein
MTRKMILMAVAAFTLATGNARAECGTLYYADGWETPFGGSPSWTYWGMAPDGVTKLYSDQYDEISDDGNRYYGLRQIYRQQNNNQVPCGYGALYTLDHKHVWYIKNGQFIPADAEARRELERP